MTSKDYSTDEAIQNKLNSEPGHHPYKADIAGYCMVCGSGTCADEGFRLLREKASRTQTVSRKDDLTPRYYSHDTGWDRIMEGVYYERAEVDLLIKELEAKLAAQAPAAEQKTQPMRLEDYHGCFTGDCPHETQAECDEDIKWARRVNRFLVWELPKSVRSDTCVTDPSYPHQRTGTNLLTADEAEAMLKYVLAEESRPGDSKDGR